MLTGYPFPAFDISVCMLDTFFTCEENAKLVHV